MLNFLVQIMAAFVGTIAFAILFDSPKRLYLISGIIGAVGWGTYILVTQYSASTVFATFIASLVLTCLSRRSSYTKKVPTTIFLICGIFALVPGIGIYNVTYYFFMNEGVKAVTEASHVLKLSIAIAFGIFVALSLPAKFFNYRLK